MFVKNWPPKDSVKEIYEKIEDFENLENIIEEIFYNFKENIINEINVIK